MAKVKHSRISGNDVSTIPIVDGQLIYTDTGEHYVDVGSERIKISNKNTVIEYDLTSQLDGVKSIFDIDDSITSNAFILLHYGGQILTKGINYTVNFSTHKLTVLFEDPLDNLDNRRLVLVVVKGLDNTVVSPHIDSVTGNWFIGNLDTEVKAQGPQGNEGIVLTYEAANSNAAQEYSINNPTVFVWVAKT